MKKGSKKNSSDSETPINSKASLKEFLLNVRDKLADGSAAPVYAFTALNHVMNLPDIYSLLSKENKEIARDIWLRLKQAGIQVNTPPMLFASEEEEVATLAQ